MVCATRSSKKLIPIEFEKYMLLWTELGAAGDIWLFKYLLKKIKLLEVDHFREKNRKDFSDIYSYNFT